MSQTPTVNKVTFETLPPNVEWDKYGIYEAELVRRSNIRPDFDGTIEPIGRKVIYRNFQEPHEFVEFVGKDYELFANEELESRMDKWATENHYKRYVDDRYSYYSEDKNRVFLTYLPEDETVGSFYVDENKDMVRVGFCTRNSVNATLGFGIDLFTYRGTCWNGSIVSMTTDRLFNTSAIRQEAAKNGAQIKQRHTKSLRDLLDDVGTNVGKLMSVGDRLVEYYRQLAQTKLDDEKAKTLLASKLPRMYLPFNVDKTTNTIDYANASMWTVYNNITENIWHNEKLDAGSKYLFFGQLHRAMANAVAPVVV